MKQPTCNRIIAIIFMGLLFLAMTRALPGQDNGTLFVKINPYTSDVKLPKAVEKQLEHAFFQWGMADHTLLIPLVNEKFVKVDTLNLTRFGEQKAVAMPPGNYTITCIAHEFNSNSTSVEKYLSKNAYFNIDVLKFRILPDKTTTIDISPNYKPQTVWFRLSKETMYLPETTVRVFESGVQVGDATVINARTEKSVAWDDYKGPLKF